MKIQAILAMFCIGFGACITTHAAEPAQQNFTQLGTLQGYRPTLIPNETIAQNIYNRMPTHEFKLNSGCFQRAHFWANDLFDQYKIKSMKVFLFFTARYQREFKYEWFYHVAPVMAVQTANGMVPMVFDPTFTSSPPNATTEEQKLYDNKPITISEWTKYFVIPQTDCPLVENYEDFENFQEQHYCYTMITPMYTYIPSNIEVEPRVRTSFREEDLKQMLKAVR